MAYSNLPTEDARLLNHEWFRWSTQRRVRTYHNGHYTSRYGRIPYTTSRFIKFPKLYSAVRAVQYRKLQFHLPKRALAVYRGQLLVGVRVSFWCGSSTTLPEWQDRGLVTVSICQSCVWHQARGKHDD